MSETTSTDIVYNQLQETHQRRNDEINYDAKPISCFKAEDIEGDEPIRKRRRRTYPNNIDETVAKDFSLFELYKCNNVEEIKLDKETILDTEELLKNLNGWTIEITKRQDKNGNYSRVDKMYRHSKSIKKLRSLVQVKKFILEKSLLRKASDDGQGSSQGANLNDDGSVKIAATEDMIDEDCIKHI